MYWGGSRSITEMLCYKNLPDNFLRVSRDATDKENPKKYSCSVWSFWGNARKNHLHRAASLVNSPFAIWEGNGKRPPRDVLYLGTHYKATKKAEGWTLCRKCRAPEFDVKTEGRMPGQDAGCWVLLTTMGCKSQAPEDSHTPGAWWEEQSVARNRKPSSNVLPVSSADRAWNL